MQTLYVNGADTQCQVIYAVQLNTEQRMKNPLQIRLEVSSQHLFRFMGIEEQTKMHPFTYIVADTQSQVVGAVELNTEERTRLETDGQELCQVKDIEQQTLKVVIREYYYEDKYFSFTYKVRSSFRCNIKKNI